MKTLSLCQNYLDLVEVLSRLKRHHVVGGDADDGFVCGVSGSVEGQRCFTWNHLHNKHTAVTDTKLPLCVSVSPQSFTEETFLYTKTLYFLFPVTIYFHRV